MVNSLVPAGALPTPAIELQPVVASSNRYIDLRPYCDKIWRENPCIWRDVLPWDFPQSASQKIEEGFLRGFFDEVECHVQGFRFLKQVWYSIALYNFETRIPAVAQWWLQQEESATYLHDPMMLQSILNPDAKPETFFQPRELKEYGLKLLTVVVQQIQHQVKVSAVPKARSDTTTLVNEPVAEPPVHAESVAATRTGRTACQAGVLPARRLSAEEPRAVPFPAYQEHVSERVLSAEYNTAFHNQPQGRKRVSSGPKRGGGGGGRYRQQGHPSDNYASQHGPALFDPYAPSNATPMASQLHERVGFAARRSNRPANLGTQNVPPQFDPRRHGFGAGEAPEQFVLQAAPQGAYSSPYPSSYISMTPSAFLDSHTPGMPYGVNFVPSQEQYADRGAINEPPMSGFQDVSNGRSGEFRSYSTSSRGRAFVSRGGFDYARGGRRDATGSSDNYVPRKPSYDENHRSFQNDQNRRGSGHRGKPWRSNSGFGRSEFNHLQRVLSESKIPRSDGSPLVRPPSSQDRFPYVGPGSLPSSAAFPTSNVPFGNTSGVHHPHRRTNLNRPQLTHNGMPIDPENQAGEAYIGLNRVDIQKLIIFNLPPSMTEEGVGHLVCNTAGVGIVGSSIQKSSKGPSGSASLTHAYIQLQSHIDARRVLAARESFRIGDIKLDVKVPKEFWDPGHKWYREFDPKMPLPPQGFSATFQSASHVPHGLPPRPKTPPFGRSQDVRYSTDEGIQHGSLRANSGYHSKAHMLVPPLPTVQSENATPTPANITTPKKSKGKKNKKAGPAQTTPVRSRPNGASRNATPSVQVSPATKPPASLPAKHMTMTVQPISQNKPTSHTPPKPITTKEKTAGSVEAHSSKTFGSAGVVQASRVDFDPSTNSESIITKDTQSTHEVSRSVSVNDKIAEGLGVSVAESEVQKKTPPHTIDAPAVLLNKRPSPPECEIPTVKPSAVDETRPTRTRVESDNVDDSFHTAHDSPLASTNRTPPPAKKSTQGPPQVNPHEPQSTKVVEAIAKVKSVDSAKEPEVCVDAANSEAKSEVNSDPVAAHNKEKNVLGLAALHSISGSSVPPTPAFETAPSMPAMPASPNYPEGSQQKSEIKKIAGTEVEKPKGPSQTESFSMFGKKQQKGKKGSKQQAKAKGSTKGKPKESSSPSIETPARKTPQVAANDSNANKKLSVKTGRDKKSSKETGKLDTNEDSVADATEKAQEVLSPTSLAGGLSGFIGNWFPGAKRPADSTSTDAPRDPASKIPLTYSKADATGGKYHAVPNPSRQSTGAATQDLSSVTGPSTAFSSEVVDRGDASSNATGGIAASSKSAQDNVSSTVTIPKMKKKSKSKKKTTDDANKNEISSDKFATYNEEYSSRITSPISIVSKGKEPVKPDKPSRESSPPPGDITASTSPAPASTISASAQKLLKFRGSTKPSSDDNLVKAKPLRNYKHRRITSNKTESENASQSSNDTNTSTNSADRRQRTKIGKAQLKTLRLLNYQSVDDLLGRRVVEDDESTPRTLRSGDGEKIYAIYGYPGDDGVIRVPGENGFDYKFVEYKGDEEVSGEQDGDETEDGESLGQVSSKDIAQDSEVQDSEVAAE